MLLGTLTTNILENKFVDKGVIKASEETNRICQDFWCRFLLKLILKYENIINTNLDLMRIIQEIIYLK